MRYTIDGLDENDTDTLVEVRGPSTPLMQPLYTRSGEVGGRVAAVGSAVGDGARLRLHTSDVDLLCPEMTTVREALRALYVDQVASTAQLLINGEPASGPDEEAAAQTKMEFPKLLALAALAAELEARTGG